MVRQTKTNTKKAATRLVIAVLTVAGYSVNCEVLNLYFIARTQQGHVFDIPSSYTT